MPSSASLLVILTVAVLRPPAEGSNVMAKVVLPAVSIELFGKVVTAKSPAFAPPMLTKGVPDKFKNPAPVFSIVKVLVILPEATSVEPKSV
ncbi:hypothetical protein FLACHUCJ7_00026 [Flavobacterium chungangense]|uniref:Uncharacterized protein n=1 Tax=Flavobacterium chungangense TaxID=554283 RepID=A0A6V6YLV6_9FLAO|nr:hypothetical protein FLACHUCJ7_00026 [Flavobacterium chungangense]